MFLSRRFRGRPCPFSNGQIRDLTTGGADGIHLCAMNHDGAAQRVYEGMRALLPERA